MQSKRNPKTLEVLELSALKLESKTSQKEIDQNQKDIKKSINSFGKQIPLPAKSEKRFNEKFGKDKEKTAIKLTLILFAIVFCFLLFFQPSIFFTANKDQTNLTNFSGREITGIKIYSLNTMLDLFGVFSAKPLFEIDKLGAWEEIKIDSNRTVVLFAVANRQLPTIGTIVVQEDYSQTATINTPNDDNSSGFYSGLRTSK